MIWDWKEYDMGLWEGCDMRLSKECDVGLWEGCDMGLSEECDVGLSR